MSEITASFTESPEGFIYVALTKSPPPIDEQHIDEQDDEIEIVLNCEDNNSDRTKLLELSRDEVSQILQYADLRTLSRLQETCQVLNELASDTDLYKNSISRLECSIDLAYSQKLFDAFTNGIEEESETMKQLLEHNHKVPHRTKYAVEAKQNTLANIKRRIARNNNIQDYDDDEMDHEGNMWKALSFFLGLGVLISSILTPLYLDGYIPKRPHYWLIPFSPSLFLIPFYIICMVWSMSKNKYYPAITRSQLKKEAYEISWKLLCGSVCVWLLWIQIAVIIKMTTNVLWTYLMIPTYVLIFFNFSGVYPRLVKEMEQKSSPMFLIYVLLTNAILLCAGIGLISAANDQLFTAQYSLLLLPFHFILVNCHICVFFLQCVLSEDSFNFCTFILQFCLSQIGLLFLTTPVFSSVLLVGLKLDGINLPFVASMSPFFGALFVYMIMVSGALLVVQCCCECDDD
ncbi:surface cell antigen [Acrasis kona]|uniref:Surface cell antigen n=1 Tax=Acrasis kona TaxID=1008807 RepID=A0AAW2YJN4_9EUKA